ncbi:hypothetical protein N7451_012738 [Penicillium sp. IBT 35674x]|nr:hypothetical protein N7451_012738 [Penicillium sp. IBT 35674x]
MATALPRQILYRLHGIYDVCCQLNTIEIRQSIVGSFFGSGAFGYFETAKDITAYCKADFLKSVGLKTPVFTRFSIVTLGREFLDLARNPRGFAIKNYTAGGNYDIVGLNFVCLPTIFTILTTDQFKPVFFCRDPIQGPDVIRSPYRNPQRFLLDHNSLFDLLANTSVAKKKAKEEKCLTNHAGLMFFSDHGTPQGWRHNHGHGCHTFNIFIFRFTADEAMRRSSGDPSGESLDYSKRDFWRAIENGEEITWIAYVQIMQPREADPDNPGFDPFDVTKIWPKSQFPLHRFSKLVLNRNPENFHRDVEQAAFSPGSMVPKTEDSLGPLLQFRTFFYRDDQLHRIGVNWHQIPVNYPFMASSYASLNFDGQMRVDANHAGYPQYAPSSFGNKLRPDTAEAPYQLAANTSALKKVDYPMIQVEYLAQLYRVSRQYAKAVYDLLPEKSFTFDEVEGNAKGAEKTGKEGTFCPSWKTDKLLGICPSAKVYNT